MFLTPLLRNTSQPLCVYMYNVSEALQHLIEMLSCQSSNNTKLLEVASLNMNTVEGVYRLHTNVTSDHHAYLYFGILTSD